MSPFYWVFTGLIKISMQLLYTIEIKGLENIPEGRAVIAPNHLSYLDPPLLGLSCPDELYGLAKQELFSVPILGRFIRRMNARPTEQNTLSQIKHLIECLNSDKKVMIFPEGTRSPDGLLQTPLKSGVVYLASKTNSPIVPVIIEGTFEAWPPHKKLPKIGSKITITYKKPIDWQEFAYCGEKIGRKQMIERLTQALKSST